MIRQTALALSVTAGLVLSGCLFPETFDARIAVRADASYTFNFNGTVAHVPAIAKTVQTAKPLSPDEDSVLRNEAAKLAKRPGVTQASYLGNGRYRIVIEDSRQAGAPMNALDMFKVWTEADGTLNIESARLDAKQMKDLKSLGLTPKGRIEVSLPKNARVIESNTTSSPWFFGLFGGYAWNIGDLSQTPRMRIRLRKQAG